LSTFATPGYDEGFPERRRTHLATDQFFHGLPGEADGSRAASTPSEDDIPPGASAIEPDAMASELGRQQRE